MTAEGSGPGSLAAFLRDVADLLRLLPERGDRARAFGYIIEVVNGADPDVLVAALGSAATSTVKEDVMNAAEKLRREGKLQGLEEGKLQGLEEGKLQGLEEGERRMPLRQLRARFGLLPADAEARVAAADEATLEAWAEAILSARVLEDVWGA